MRAPTSSTSSFPRRRVLSFAGGPKAHQQASPARAALGSRTKSSSKPQRGGTNSNVGADDSVPNVSFINLHPMFPAKRAELILKRHLAMMLLLRRDICTDLFNVRLAERKCAVSALPEEIGECCPLLLYPLRGTLLRLLHQPGDGDGEGKVAEDVNMIFNAADEDGLAADGLQNTREPPPRAREFLGVSPERRKTPRDLSIARGS